jgi:hypothetical protein
MAFILTKPRPGSGGGQAGIIIENVPVQKVEDAPLNVVVVDAASDSSATVKWTYTIIDDANQKVLTAEVIANNSFNNKIRHNRHSMVGDLLRHSVDVKYLPGQIALEITNLTSFDFRVNIMRIELPS